MPKQQEAVLIVQLPLEVSIVIGIGTIIKCLNALYGLSVGYIE